MWPLPAAALSSVTLQPGGPDNWATSMGRQQGQKKPAQALWWPQDGSGMGSPAPRPQQPLAGA